MAPLMASKRLFDSVWPATLRGLRSICEDPAARPDFVLADFFAESAARDVLRQYGIQIAVVWPQMPFLMAPAPYISGQPGFEADRSALTSEHASLLARFRNELVIVRGLPELVSWRLWTGRMRADAGVRYSLPVLTKPDYLVFVNTFFGLEVPRDLPPLMAAVGPILADEYPPLDDALSAFLQTHDRTVYISLGTHIALPTSDVLKVLRAMLQCLEARHINGIIWSLPNLSALISQSPPETDGTTARILANHHPNFHLSPFVPQRAILDHTSTILFLTHGGGSSANEALFHGSPALTMGFFFDQLCNSARLLHAGVGLSLDKSAFTPESITRSVGRILKDEDGSFARNVRRMQTIARVASRRKHHAADLIEEVMYDQELRFRDGIELRPMHLQTADARMPAWKARNWDMWFVGLTGLTASAVACWWAVRYGWRGLPGLLAISRDSWTRLTGTAISQRLRGIV